MTESDSPISSHLDLPESPSQIIGRRKNRLGNIIKQNDLPQPRQFIASCSSEDVIAPGTPYLEETLSMRSRPVALHILLEVYTAALEVVQKFNPKFRLLDACGAANIDVGQWIYIREIDSGDTPILAATGSLMYLDKDADEVEDDVLCWYEWIRNRIARSHQLINFLLDWGCSATDVIPPLPNDLSPWGSQVQGNVLGLGVPRANSPLIQRLIDSGADIYLKNQHFHHGSVPLQSRIAKGHTHDVTTLHLTSLFYNSDAVKLLLDHQNYKKNANPELAASCDSDGRLPLHWAASGPGDLNCRLLDKQLRITQTLRLLLDYDPTGINLVDNTRSTPLHYPAISHAMCDCSQYAELAIRTLLEYRADPRIPDGLGCTIPHLLGYHSHQGDPVNTMLLDLILSYGGNIKHTETTGKLHCTFLLGICDRSQRPSS
ncbi:hypothetical protein PENNAL_c0010G05176 [Penicillium nalgiovense]|uniref:Uncharacterized protein n=1 Tax=Penicillium nalgiovense TaxID=60175 RepID=A0A1V6YV25_PENNA|nr:hypothetical protein PENNAL_c0010G05176 [Penicillium nalgiovense]